MAQSGIEPATFRRVAQCLKQLRHPVHLHGVDRCKFTVNVPGVCAPPPMLYKAFYAHSLIFQNHFSLPPPPPIHTFSKSKNSFFAFFPDTFVLASSASSVSLCAHLWRCIFSSCLHIVQSSSIVVYCYILKR